MKSSWPSSPAGRRKGEGLEAEAGRHQPEQLAADSRTETVVPRQSDHLTGPGLPTWQLHPVLLLVLVSPGLLLLVSLGGLHRVPKCVCVCVSTRVVRCVCMDEGVAPVVGV